jgi:hypothetical protein
LSCPSSGRPGNAIDLKLSFMHPRMLFSKDDQFMVTIVISRVKEVETTSTPASGPKLHTARG